MRIPRGAVALALGLALVLPLTAWVADGVATQPRWMGAVQGYVAVGGSPYDEQPQGPVAFDPANGEIYVQSSLPPSLAYNNLTAINASTGDVVASISFPPGDNDVITAIEVDPLHDVLFVDTYDGNISVVSGRTDSIVSTIPIGGDLTQMAFDPVSDLLFVAQMVPSSQPGFYHDDIAVIDTTNDSMVGTVPGGGAPMAVSPDGRALIVASYDSENLSVVNTQTLATEGAVSGVGCPSAWMISPMAFDSRNGELYVDEGGEPSLVSVINITSDRQIARISTPDASNEYDASLAYDATNGYLYALGVPNHADGGYDNGEIDVINGATNAWLGNLSVGQEPVNLAVDSASGRLYVVDPPWGRLWTVDPNAPAPGTYAVVVSLPGVGWAFLGIFVGAMFLVVGVRRLWTRNRATERPPTKTKGEGEGLGPRAKATDPSPSSAEPKAPARPPAS